MLTRLRLFLPRFFKDEGGTDNESLRKSITGLTKDVEELKKAIGLYFDSLNKPGALYLTQAAILNATIDDSTIGATTASTGGFTSLTFTGTIRGADGTAAAPAYSFSSSGNTDNGMYLPAANTLGFAAAGALQVTINSTGMGVGITPTQKLHTSVADNSLAALFAGQSKAVRAYVTSAYSFIEGTDQTGVGSYQPFVIGGSTLDFAISGTAKVSINSSGHLIPTQLVDISGASAGQIKFPATQNASSDANTLDDYKEGTWTPNDSSGASLSFGVAVGTYTKKGREVTAQCTVTYPATANGANAVIGGLPFTIGSSNSVSVCYCTDATATVALGSATTALVALVAAGGAAARTNAQLSGDTIVFTLTYEV